MPAGPHNISNTLVGATAKILKIIDGLPSDHHRWRVLKAVSWIAFGDGDIEPEQRLMEEGNGSTNP